MRERSLFWDNFKGILILLVVFGHYIYSYSNKLPDSLARDIFVWIYTFHMPAFIFCSGYFSKSERSRSKESLVKLFLYYAVFNTLMLIFVYFHKGTNPKLLSAYYSYWYILSLIAWRLMIGDLGNIRGIVLVSAIVTLGMGYWSEFSHVLSVRRTVAFFCFFAAGYVLDKEKLENFIRNRKPLLRVLGGLLAIGAAVFIFWAVEHFGIKSSMTMMSPYQDEKDMFCRAVLLGIAALAILLMILTVPNCRIPLLSKIGKNSLLIYLAHRFLTIIYYDKLFTWQNYTDAYLLYALIATVLTCWAFGSNRLNAAVAQVCDKAAAAIVDPNSKQGMRIKTAMLLVFAILMCTKVFQQ